MDNQRFRNLLAAYPKKALQFLYTHYHATLLNTAYMRVHDQQAAEDIVQETFVHIWSEHKHLSKHHDLSIEFYLLKVVRNKAITHFYKHHKQQLERAQYTHNLKATTPTVETNIIQSETASQIRKAINTFPQRERQCLLMRLDEELSVKQMADRLNVTIKAIERSLTAGNKRLKRYWLTVRNPCTPMSISLSIQFQSTFKARIV
jgi:RNA polymerase sigma-70 factor (ECF subfamily)